MELEKHFTTSNKLAGRDNKFAILPSELNRLKSYSDKVKQMNVKLGLDLQMQKDVFKAEEDGKYS